LQQLNETPNVLDASHPQLYRDDSWRPLFDTLRAEHPVYYCPQSRSGPYWSISRYADIVRVDTDPQSFSSSYLHGGVTIEDRVAASFMQMDPPAHTEKRRNVTAVVAPKSLAQMEGLIRERAGRVLDALPRNEEFDWVEQVSIELTSMMLATLFAYPVEQRHKLVDWSNLLTADLDDPESPIRTEEERQAGLQEFYLTMLELWQQRQKEPQSYDIISLLAHDESVRSASFEEICALFGLFLVGGNDTTRNSMSGGAWGFSQFPEEWRKLQANPSLAGNAAAEIIRYQTPVIYQRRTATRDVVVGGETIAAGDKVVMWYISGNRDESVFADADRLQVDRPNARQHIAFGMGPHRCLGARLAEMQLRILWEEVLARDLAIEILAPPVYAYSNLVRSPLSLRARING
jgi:cytochrome P450